MSMQVPTARATIRVRMASMDRHRLLQYLEECLADFYADGGQEFWRIFEETPRAAVAAFKTKPEVFGTLQKPYAQWPKLMAKQHKRISDQLDVLSEAGVIDAMAEPLVL